nr:hypothetical protein B0A51_00540 [Rachicladosporium sp. CCFEE 5018]
MRRGILLFILLTAAILIFAVSQVWNLLGLLFDSGLSDKILKSELPALNAKPSKDTTQLIPKILHQTYKTETIPEIWEEAQKSCLDLHPAPGWEYKLWTDESSAEFIKEMYPWFWETFESYSYPIQRADAIRYFVLAHFGGVYLDLDDGCARDMAPLLAYPAWVRKTMPTGISNDAMGAVPHHPFFERVIKDIAGYKRSWLLPYITVMGSTGPLFLSVLWRRWSAEGFNVGEGRVRIIFGEEYQGNEWSFFTHHKGDSWHGYDVQLIFWMARHWVVVTVIGWVIGLTVLFVVWYAYQRYLLRGQAGNTRRKPVSSGARWKFWQRADAQTESMSWHTSHSIGTRTFARSKFDAHDIKSSPATSKTTTHTEDIETIVNMPSHKSFRTKTKLAKAQKQNRPIPQWIRLKTNNTIRYNAKRRHWRKTRIGI